MMDPVDDLLSEKGEVWRDSLGAVPNAHRFVPAMRIARRVWPRRVLLAGGAFAMVAVAAAQVVPILNPRTGPSIGSLQGQPLKEGDSVWAFGSVMIGPGGAPMLCRAVVVDLSMDGRPTCSPNHVELEGVDVQALPGARDIAGSQVADGLTLEGHWSGSRFVVRSVQRGTAAADPAPPVACEPPAGGWAKMPTTPVGAEAAGAALESAINGRPDVYSGSWLTVDGSGEPITVVGAVGDPVAARADLRNVYPYPMCIVPAEFSRQALERVARLLAKPDWTWQATIDPRRDRVIVDLPFVDAAAEAALADHPEALPRPLVSPR